MWPTARCHFERSTSPFSKKFLLPVRVLSPPEAVASDESYLRSLPTRLHQVSVFSLDPSLNPTNALATAVETIPDRDTPTGVAVLPRRLYRQLLNRRRVVTQWSNTVSLIDLVNRAQVLDNSHSETYVVTVARISGYHRSGTNLRSSQHRFNHCNTIDLTPIQGSTNPHQNLGTLTPGLVASIRTPSPSPLTRSSTNGLGLAVVTSSQRSSNTFVLCWPPYIAWHSVRSSRLLSSPDLDWHSL